MRTAILALAAFAIPGIAAAQTAGTVTNDLNLRAGPGQSHQVVTSMPSGSQVAILGCDDARGWCQVNYAGNTGYAASRYLAVNHNGETVVIAEQPGLIESVVGGAVDTVADTSNAVVGAVAGAVNGAVDAVTPDRQTVTYIERNPTQSVRFNGDVVVGADVPADVALQPVPETRYQYAYINERPVLVDPNSRRIVYVYN